MSTAGGGASSGTRAMTMTIVGNGKVSNNYNGDNDNHYSQIRVDGGSGPGGAAAGLDGSSETSLISSNTTYMSEC